LLKLKEIDKGEMHYGKRLHDILIQNFIYRSGIYKILSVVSTTLLLILLFFLLFGKTNHSPSIPITHEFSVFCLLLFPHICVKILNHNPAMLENFALI